MHIRPVTPILRNARRLAAPRLPMTASSDILVRRLELNGAVQALNSQLLASPSATLTLEAWCRRHGLGEGRVRAELQASVADAPSAEQQERLGCAADEPMRYRRVMLCCGDLVLSEAENWYLPSRLTPRMNAELDTGETPYGRVVWPLKPFRRTTLSRQLWLPLPEHWTALSRDALAEQAADPTANADLAYDPALPVLEHRALVFAGNGTPIAEVREVYKMTLLANRFG